MTPERWQQVERLYHEARTRPPGERAHFLSGACGDDDALRREVESLLSEPVSKEGFLDRPALARAAEQITTELPAALSSRMIGAYRVHSMLGAGGMGEVYRAHDAKLGRDVAIKILPPAFTSDPNRLTRFEREARMLAALNHPNICAIYGLEEADGARFLVLELVEGKTLADMLSERAPAKAATRGLPLATALTIARQVAEALEIAHKKGIIHRDLKPANIKITPTGAVKVLDFGLAKTAVDEDLHLDLAQRATLAGHETQEGLVVGTPAYMSPEQARGKPIDTRTDIWAFGCVLYEMLTGQTTFAGSSAMDTIAKILEREPDWSALPATVPAPIRTLLRGCLAKDPEQRLKDIGDTKTAIDRARPESSRWVSRFGWLPWAAAAALALGLAGMAAWSLRNPRPGPAPPPDRYALSLPFPQKLDPSGGAHTIALSPDGNMLAYVATPLRLYLHLMSELDITPISGTEKSVGVREPVFSPDGLSIAFYGSKEQALMKMPVKGGDPQMICPIDTPTGMNWGPDGIVFGQGKKGIWLVSPEPDSPKALLVPVADGQSAHGPQILPDRQHVLFTLATGTLRNRWDKAHIVVQSLTLPSEPKHLRVKNEPLVGSDARYIPRMELLFYAVSGRLLAVQFDPKRLETRGEAFEIVRGVNRAAGPFTGAADFTVSSEGYGRFVYVPGQEEAPNSAPFDLALFDPNSKLPSAPGAKDAEPLGLRPGSYALPRVSPDGARVVFANDDLEGTIWTCDLKCPGEPRQLPIAGRGRFPIWIKDSQHIAYQSSGLGIVMQTTDGSGTPITLINPEPGEALVPESYSRQADVMLYSVKKDSQYSLWKHSFRDGKNEPWAGVRSLIPTEATFSPDGNWVAYTKEVKGKGITFYVRAFPAGEEYNYEAQGSDSPKHARWWDDGKKLKLFFDPRPGSFESVIVRTQPVFGFENLTRLPPVFGLGQPGAPGNYDVVPTDGRIVGLVTSGHREIVRNPLDQLQVISSFFEWFSQHFPSR